MDIASILQDTEKRLDELFTEFDNTIEAAIEDLKDKVLKASKEIPSKKGTLLPELKPAQEMHQQILSDFEETYNKAVEDIVNRIDVVNGIIKDELVALSLPAAFSAMATKTFAEMREQIGLNLINIGESVANDITKSLYAHVTTGSSYSNLVRDIQSALIDYKTTSGVSLTQYAETYAHDAVMDYYRQAYRRVAMDSGLKQYLFYGDIMYSSRPFCIARAMKVFTEQEILSWENLKWQGKAPGPIFTVCGGYNCRHRFVAVKPEWLGNLELQNYFDENPDKYSPRIRAAVDAELKRINPL